MALFSGMIVHPALVTGRHIGLPYEVPGIIMREKVSRRLAVGGGIALIAQMLRHGSELSCLRIALGGAAIIALTLLVGSGDYNGAGMGVITRAIEHGTAHPLAFLLKLVFTAITIGSGFKGGEVIPTFFIGATLGAVLGPVLGMPAGFAAALGLVCLFCGAVNCPIASIVLSVELFGGGNLIYFALGCGVAYMLSGYFGLYSSQKILYSKLRAEFININAK